MAAAATLSSSAEGQRGGAELTHSNALKAVEEVKNWRKLGEWLRVPSSEMDEIEKNNATEEECMSILLKSWMKSEHPASPTWRRMILALDTIVEEDPQAQQAADKIRNYAEPVKDSTLIVDNVKTAVTAQKRVSMEDFELLAYSLAVPEPKRMKFMSSSLSAEQKMEAVLDYWIKIVPGASWERLAGALYYLEWEEVMQEAKKYIQKQRDPPNLGKLHRSLKAISDEWDDLARRIDVPLSKRKEIAQQLQYSSPAERLYAVLEYWIHTHPAPSWQMIEQALYRMTSVEAHIVRSEILKNFQLKQPEIEEQPQSKTNTEKLIQQMELLQIESEKNARKIMIERRERQEQIRTLLKEKEEQKRKLDVAQKQLNELKAQLEQSEGGKGHDPDYVQSAVSLNILMETKALPMMLLATMMLLLVYVLLSGGLGWTFTEREDPDGRQVYLPYQTNERIAELMALNKSKEKFTTDFNKHYPEIAYLAFQAEIINETALESILVYSESNKNPALTTFNAIQYGISHNPMLFHKFVYLLLYMDEEVVKELANELREKYVHEIRKLLFRTQPILSDTVDYNGKHIDQWEEYHGIMLDIPRGAIPQGKNVTFVVSYTASEFLPVPEGYEAVSSVYRILPSFQFSKQITVRIEHWALIESEDSISRMAFFHDSNGIQIVHGTFQKRSSWGVLETPTLCNIYVCRTLLSGIFIGTLLYVPIISLLYPQISEEKSYQVETYQVDMCIQKANEWTSYLCVIALKHEMDSCIWLQHDKVRGSGWDHLMQAKRIFQFAPNCDDLEFDEEVSKLTATEQGYKLHFGCMTKIQRIALEKRKTPLCQTIELIPNESSSNCMQLNCPLPLKCTRDFNTTRQCNLTLRIPVSSCGTGQKSGAYAHIDQRVWMFDLHLFNWEEEGQRRSRNIISEVAHRWRALGRSFGFEEGVLDSIEVKKQRDQEECCYAVIQKWRESGSEKYPVTWRGFIKVLEDNGFQILADDLRTILPKKKLLV